MSAGALSKIVEQIVSWLSNSNLNTPSWTQDEWQLFKKTTFIHGVAPILFKQLENNQVPSDIQQWLQWQYDSNHNRVIRLQSDLQAILSTFARVSVPIMPLKGAVLIAKYFDDIALRPTADIDLLIHPEDFPHSLNLLAHLGYEVEKSNWKHAILSKPNNRAIASVEVEHPDNPRRVDLHTACHEMLSGPSVDITADIWTTAIQEERYGQPTYLPNTCMLHLHLLLHASSNIWNGVLRLINLWDILQISKAQPANQFKTQIDPRFIYPALLFCQRYLPHPYIQEHLKYFDTAVPASFKHWLATQDIISRSRLTRESWFTYLTRVFILYRERPKDIPKALRFLKQQIR